MARRAGCLMCKFWKIAGSKLNSQLKPSELREAQPDEGRPVKRHKGSRTKWCKGKVGMPHLPICLTYEQAKGKIQNKEHFSPKGLEATLAERFLVCRVCGKVLEHTAGNFPPDWVTC